jgi:hypothetical protein
LTANERFTVLPVLRALSNAGVPGRGDENTIGVPVAQGAGRGVAMRRLFDHIGIRLTGREDLSAQYQRYRETVLWLLGELFRFDRKSTLKSVLFNVLGGVVKAGSLAFLLYYASLMESGGSTTLLGYTLEYRSEPVFYLAISIALVLLLSGSFMVYAGNHVVNVLSVAFASRCSQAVIASSGRRPPGNPDPSLSAYPVRVSGNVTGIVRLSRAVKKLLQASNPLAMLVYSLIVIIYLNAMLSLVVMLIALPTLLLQYVVNYQSAQNEKLFDASRTGGLKKLIKLLGNHALTPGLHAGAVRQLEHEYQHSVIGDFLGSYYQRIMAPTKSALVSDLLLATLSFLLVILLGRNALNGTITWTHFISYLLFARIALLSFRGVLVAVTGFARHYTRTRKVYEYLGTAAEPVQGLNEAIVVTSRGEDCTGDRKQARLQAGRPLMIISPVPLSRFNLYAFADTLAGGSRKPANVLCDSMSCVSSGLHARPGGSLNELLSIPADAGNAVAGEILQQAGLPADVERDVTLSRRAWRDLPGRARALVLLRGDWSEIADVILVDNELLLTAGPGEAARWLDEHAERKLGIVSRNLQDLDGYEGKFVVLMAQDRSVSLASKVWCESNHAAIEAWFARHAVEAGEDDEDGDLFEE